MVKNMQNGIGSMQNGTEAHADSAHHLPPDVVLIAGGGPVGLLLSVVLASYGVRSILFERNSTTTRWPKMDLTNARSMEMFRRLGLAEGLRARGVPSHIPSTVLISSGLKNKEPITRWLHPSVDEYRSRIRKQNDGTMPLEPYQRISQSVLEAWLKSYCDQSPLIDARFGWKVESVEDGQDGVTAIVSEAATGEKHVFHSSFLIGCDGASSRVRRYLNIKLDGGPVPGYTLLVHFKSKDLARLQNQGQFWHIFFTGESGLKSAIIAQDEVDTWTTHLQMTLDSDHAAIESHEAVYRSLGGLDGSYEVEIDEILVRSAYRPSIAVADSYRSTQGHVFLAGDAAHQNIPTGGYGMNLGLADAFDLGWKLATYINGNGGKGLLSSYESDRRPVALTTIARSGVHMATHSALEGLLKPNAHIVDAPSNEGEEMRQKIHQHYQRNDGENTDLGIEMGYRYTSNICVQNDDLGTEPDWHPSRYTPTTWPGSRAPHIFLKDGTAIFDHYGQYYTLIEFADENETDSTRATLLLAAAEAGSVPLKHVKLIGEDQARQLWERNLVIVRPDGHVSWRGDEVRDLQSASTILFAIAGRSAAQSQPAPAKNGAPELPESTFDVVLREVQGQQYEMEMMGAFQR